MENKSKALRIFQRCFIKFVLQLLPLLTKLPTLREDWDETVLSWDDINKVQQNCRIEVSQAWMFNRLKPSPTFWHSSNSICSVATWQPGCFKLLSRSHHPKHKLWIWTCSLSTVPVAVRVFSLHPFNSSCNCRNNKDQMIKLYQIIINYIQLQYIHCPDYQMFQPCFATPSFPFLAPSLAQALFQRTSPTTFHNAKALVALELPSELLVTDLSAVYCWAIRLKPYFL